MYSQPLAIHLYDSFCWIIPLHIVANCLRKCKQTKQPMYSNLKANNLFAMKVFVVTVYIVIK